LLLPATSFMQERLCCEHNNGNLALARPNMPPKTWTAQS
jgi:hypothetical protein